MKTRILCLLLALLAIAVPASLLTQCDNSAHGAVIVAHGPVVHGSVPATEFVTGQILDSPRQNGDNYFTGFKFTVGGAGITVTELGRWNYSGDSQTHTLCITDSTGAILASVSINAALGTPGSYQFAALGSPVVLSASTVYAVLSQEPNGDTFEDGIGGDISYTSVATVNGAVYAGQTPGLPLNVVAAGDFSYGPVNFKYTP